MRRPEEAAAEFRAALAINPRSVMALHDLGGLLLRAGRVHEAADYLAQGAALEPFNGLIQADLRTALLRQGRLEEAQAAWRKAIDAGPLEHDAWFGFAELCLFLGKMDEYQRARSELLARFRDAADPQVAERVGRACLLLPCGKVELKQAIALTQRAMDAREPKYKWARPYFTFAQGLAAYRVGRFDDAVKLMNGEAASLKEPSPRLLLAMSQYQEGRRELAQKLLAEAIRSYDWNPAKATHHEAWIAHILRREAEALILSTHPASRKAEK
jgi:serine/threonine-protein kinase